MSIVLYLIIDEIHLINYSTKKQQKIKSYSLKYFRLYSDIAGNGQWDPTSCWLFDYFYCRLRIIFTIILL